MTGFVKPLSIEDYRDYRIEIMMDGRRDNNSRGFKIKKKLPDCKRYTHIHSVYGVKSSDVLKEAKMYVDELY